MRIGIVAVSGEATTARYFESAALEQGHEIVCFERIPRAGQLNGLDVLLVFDPALFNVGPLVACPCPVVGYLIDVHMDIEIRLAFARYLDHVFIAQPDYLERFRNLPHDSVEWMALGCEPRVHYVADQPRIFDVGFVGQLGKPDTERRNTLTCVLSQFATNDVSRRYSPTEMGRIYSQSKIVFNKSINRDLNMRFYEGLASGALLVTDHIENGLSEIGEDGIHYVTYRNSQEAIEKIRHYLAHDDERRRIASAGQELVLSHHTYTHRLTQMLDVVARTPAVHAPARRAPAPLEAQWRSAFMRRRGARASEALALLAHGGASPKVAWEAGAAVVKSNLQSLRQARKRLYGRLRA